MGDREPRESGLATGGCVDCDLAAMISTRRRLEYASGYLELGLAEEARAELLAIPQADRTRPEVLQVWSDYHFHRKQWNRLILTARALAKAKPDEPAGWISWAYALRELGRIAEAQEVLREAEPRHAASCAVLHYNLACYACLLGDRLEARRRLKRALRFGREWLKAALGDPDLAAMRAELAQWDAGGATAA